MDRNVIIASLRENQLKDWVIPESPIQLNSLAWTPDFVSSDSVAVLVLGAEVQPFLQKRMRAAKDAGFLVSCICTLASLSASDNLELFSELDASVLLLDEGAVSSVFLPLLKSLGVEQVGVVPAVRSKLVADGLKRCNEATTTDLKGKTLEWLLHFMFSQVVDFRVISCNYHTTNEELDALIQLRTQNPEHSWAHKSAPYIVVEAKNRKDKQGQEVVSKLHTVIQTKAGNCKIGFLVSLSGFTSGAIDQRLKLAMSDITFVLMDGDDLQEWAGAVDYEDKLDEVVRKAMLP
jgi:hypothetical protein